MSVYKPLWLVVITTAAIWLLLYWALAFDGYLNISGGLQAPDEKMASLRVTERDCSAHRREWTRELIERPDLNIDALLESKCKVFIRVANANAERHVAAYEEEYFSALEVRRKEIVETVLGGVYGFAIALGIGFVVQIALNTCKIRKSADPGNI